MQTVSTIIKTDTAKQLIDSYIEQFCQSRSKQAMAIGPSYFQLWQSIERLILAGGKRLRPYMIMATYQAYKPEGDITDVLPAAAAHELIHMAMLIHDDIIDRDTVRYGIPNISGQYETAYSEFFDTGSERAHMSLSAALLAGDVLITDAHEMLRQTNRPAELVNRTQSIFNNEIFEVVGGELLDMEVSFLPQGTVSADTIAIYKTASYSFVGPLTTGAVLAEAPEQDIATLKELSIILGVGYQLRDDILGTFGSADTTGKSTTTDITEGKRTYLIEKFEQLASTQQSEQFFAIFHQASASQEQLAAAKTLLVETGAREAVELLIAEKRSRAIEKVQALTLSDESKQLYFALIERCLDREV
jgi:geranylgeranyl diphosphate synthase type II